MRGSSHNYVLSIRATSSLSQFRETVPLIEIKELNLLAVSSRKVWWGNQLYPIVHPIYNIKLYRKRTEKSYRTSDNSFSNSMLFDTNEFCGDI